MVRYAALAISATAILIGVVNAVPLWLSLPNELHQIVAADLGGTYTRDFVQVGQNCPQAISHSSFKITGNIITVPYQSIQQDTQQCTGSGMMFVGANRDILTGFNSLLSPGSTAKALIQAIDNTEATPLFGIQPARRQCGTSSLPANTLFVFFRQIFDVKIGPGLTLVANRRYMLVMRPGDPSPCVYFAPLRQGSGNGGPASPQPTEDPDATADPTGGSGGSTGGGGGSTGGSGGSTGGGGGPNSTSAPSVSEAPNASLDPGVTETPDANGDNGGVDTFGDPDASPSQTPDDPVCFPGDATVELHDGSSKTMEGLALNDKVRVAGAEHSEVFMFTHRMKDAMYKFIKLTTDRGVLTATGGHYVYVNNRLTAMRAIKVGDYLTYRDGSASVISKVETVMARGLFNPQTLHGDIYVNGFKASTYTTAVEPSFAHNILAPLRALHRLGMNPLAFAFSHGSEFLARFTPKGATVY